MFLHLWFAPDDIMDQGLRPQRQGQELSRRRTNICMILYWCVLDIIYCLIRMRKLNLIENQNAATNRYSFGDNILHYSQTQQTYE